MKLRIKAAPVVVPPSAFDYPGAEQSKPLPAIFHVERSVGLLLLAIGGDRLEEVVDPVPAVDLSVRWRVFGDEGSTALPGIKADCPRCSCGVVLYAIRPFKHCRREDFPPPEIEEAFERLAKAHKPVKRETAPMNQGAVGWIGNL